MGGDTACFQARIGDRWLAAVGCVGVLPLISFLNRVMALNSCVESDNCTPARTRTVRQLDSRYRSDQTLCSHHHQAVLPTPRVHSKVTHQASLRPKRYDVRVPDRREWDMLGHQSGTADKCVLRTCLQSLAEPYINRCVHNPYSVLRP